MAVKIEVLVGRIETLAVDAVVNAANRWLLPGGGVDGALRRAAGPELTQLTETMPHLADGEAALTPGFRAPARTIIHTAAPIWFAEGTEAEKVARLAACYRSAIEVAHANGLASLAFPCLGTGAFAWPPPLACGVAIEATRTALARAPSIERLIFCCFTPEDAALYEAALNVS